jgi:hypothetical protein
MTRLATAALLSAAIAGFSTQQVRGTALPSVVDRSFIQFEIARSGTGPDGNNRFIWDYFSSTVPPIYAGAGLWILGPTGNIWALEM